uniref:Uncharacterized protein n=1 Tax=Romanomermis culicivorax TaxID=13658 RepID=A0A915L8W9_ROMCU
MDNVHAKWFLTNPEGKQTPGLLEVEWKSMSMYCLSTKTYIGIDEETTKQKVMVSAIRLLAIVSNGVKSN